MESTDIERTGRKIKQNSSQRVRKGGIAGSFEVLVVIIIMKQQNNGRENSYKHTGRGGKKWKRKLKRYQSDAREDSRYKRTRIREKKEEAK